MTLPDVEAVLARGQRAAGLLADSTFLAVVDDLSNYHLAAMCACQPGERHRETRDYHHTLHFALCETVQTLQGYAAAADKIMQDNLADSEEEDLD